MYATLSLPSLLPFVSHNVNNTSISTLGRINFYSGKSPTVTGRSLRHATARCKARRQIRWEENDNEHGHNEEIALLEFYTQIAKEEALLVKAVVDGEEVEILVFKGFSSSLSSGTSSDPTRSILPARAVIKSIDRVKGPFNPSDIDYIEKGLIIEAFRAVVQKIKAVADHQQFG